MARAYGRRRRAATPGLRGPCLYHAIDGVRGVARKLDGAGRARLDARMVDLSGPLQGLRIVEFGHFIAAPFATRVLADMGAEVIKVEPPGGDPVRSWGAQIDGRSLWWSVHGRNKRCVTLDLKAPGARAIALDLVARSHAVVENFRPGLMEKFGLGPGELAEARPGCILVRISGFGQTGPRRLDPSFGMIGEAVGGIRHLTGHPPEVSDLPSVRTGVSLGDSVAGLYGAIGLLAALHEQRERPPVPGMPARIIDVALTESVLSLLEGMLPEYGALGRIRGPNGARIPTAAPSNAYRCADGAWIVIGGNSQPLWERLAALMGKPGLARDPRFADNPSRVQNVEALDAEIGEWAARRPADEVVADLEKTGIPASKIYTVADIAADAQYRAREAVRAVPDPVLDQPILHPAPVPRFGGPGPQEGIAWTGPAIGAHNDEVYGGLLGLAPDRLEALRRSGTI
jgi:crotonobetainyl-CoA:carnitine CoA-transferase CaiB-like acyl-CoA transferase